MAATLTFADSDFLQSALFPPSPHGIRYQIFTETGFFGGRKVTTITPIQHEVNVRTVPSGVIDWKRHMFGVGGRMTDWSALKRKTGGMFSRSREWQWSNTPYTVKFGHDQWLATSARPSYGHGHPSTSAVFNLRQRHLLRKSEPAYIQLSQDIPVEDQIFLILVMLYSEAKRQDRKRAASSAAAANAGAAGGGGGGGGGGGC